VSAGGIVPVQLHATQAFVAEYATQSVCFPAAMRFVRLYLAVVCVLAAC
jgi:hypothetical protein